MKKNKKLFILVALFLAVFAVGGTLAYLTDTSDELTNTFTFGKVEIELKEDSWKAADATNLNPGKVLPKDPAVTVKSGSKDAYVFMEVEMPAQVNNKDVVTLGAIDSGWKAISTNGNKTVYAYGSESSMTKVAAEASTSALFSQVTVNGNLKDADITAIGNDGVKIKVKACAIQADDLAETTPAAIWAALQSNL